MKEAQIVVGTAAWTVPSALKDVIGGEGSHLYRYSHMLKCVEINTSFYRDHKAATYEKWAMTTPTHFRFAVKLSKVFTHDNQLAVDPLALHAVLEGIMHLGEKLGGDPGAIAPQAGFS